MVRARLGRGEFEMMSYHGAAGAVAQTASISLAREVGVFLSWQSIAAKKRIAMDSGTTTGPF